MAITLAGLAATGFPATAHATPATPKTPKAAKTAAARLPAGRSWKVTLVTGDTVQVHTVKNRPPMVSVQPGKGRTNVPFVRDIRPDGTIRVIPVDVGRLIGKKIDPALFNVTTLIEQGDDDASRSTLPLIVQGGDAQGRSLKAVRATAVRQPKGKRPAALTASGKLASGVQHIWLDRKVKATKLDRDLEQIGAPAAWTAGATGKGVDVAVLDTGIDATHPDLKGQIAEQQNFATDSKDTVDRFGHGTHVAATIAGTGAAAHGQRKGVAPDAHLLIGKVLDDTGSGYESDVIKGMEWAAPKAKIVSMSLGSPVDDTADPDSDPVAKTADDLTAQYGTLFVVAAGNDGPDADTVGSPGIAPAALTVGAVDGDDKPADFSSRGGSLLKPDIAAPGVDTVSARAAGTTMGSPVDAYYTAASGTSMATPHVAGAAADLLQKHPDWTPARLKAALTSTAHAVTGSVYQVGAGRLDVAAAVAATVTADDSGVAFGRIPHGSTQTVTKKLSWTNTGSSPVEMRLSAAFTDHAGHDPGAVQVPASVTVPAGGSASATLTLDPSRLSTGGYYSGAVTAQAGGVTLRTPLGAFAEPETHTLTLKATPLPDAPKGSTVAEAWVINLDDPNTLSTLSAIDDSGVATVPVATGRYIVLGLIEETGSESAPIALAGTSEVNVDRDTALSLDASKAEPVKIAAPGASKMSDLSLQIERGTADGIWNFQLDYPTLYSTPIDAPKTGTLNVYVGGRVSSDDGTKVYSLLHDLGSRVPDKIDYTADQEEFARIDERFHALGGDTSTPVRHVRRGVTPAGFMVDQTPEDVAAGSARTDYVTATGGVRWQDEAGPANDTVGRLPQETVRTYSPGGVYTEDWMRQPTRPGPYSATGETGSFCVPRPVTRAPGNIHVELVPLQDRVDGFDCTVAIGDDLPGQATHSMKLYADDSLAGTSAHSYGDFSVPAKAGTYRLVYDLDTSKLTPVSGKTSTTWTFRSKPGETRVPLLTVDYALPLDLLNHPNGDTATFTVARVKGSATAKATGLKLWTSLDDGTTWQEATVTAGSNGKYTAKLPKAGNGQGVSLRVQATDSGGSKIDQTVIRAYTGN
ncbi:S8 family serine peptidase [Actinoallomurus vinaceus]|uniref:S8 family serine peptidase n=1 Tax=Actinoallomurus vinaceus TaxID=1080074 RepID=A0ABP8U0Q1_9ACTN